MTIPKLIYLSVALAGLAGGVAEAAKCPAEERGRIIVSGGKTEYHIPKPLYDWTRYYAYAYGLEPGLLMALIWSESTYCQRAVSSTGAIGLGQLMPGTAADMGVNPNDPVHNIYGSARYLREQYNEFGNWPLALAAYNAGPGNVRKYGGVPPFKETVDYVNRVFDMYARFRDVK